MTKKYYWLKLKDDFFSDKKIKKLRRVAGGDTYTVIYLKMQLLSLKHDGLILFDDLESQMYEEIALEIDEKEENVKFTLLFLIQYGLIEEIDEKTLMLKETVSNIGRESESAERVRRLRERKKSEEKKALQCNVTEVTCNTEKELEKELEKEIDKLPSSAKPTKQVSKYDESSPYYGMAKYLYDKMLINNPKAKEPNYQVWADDFRKIIELDERDALDVKSIIDFSQNDSFWCSNILSPAKLRKQYDQLSIKMNQRSNNKNNNQYQKQDAMSLMLDKFENGGFGNEQRKDEPGSDRILIP